MARFGPPVIATAYISTIFMDFTAVCFVMRFKTQPYKLPIVNLESLVPHQQEQMVKRHGSLLLDSNKSAFCSQSSCGETNVLLSLILHPKEIGFNNIYFYSKYL